jgi:hypothetical protein
VAARGHVRLQRGEPLRETVDFDVAAVELDLRTLL